MDKLVIISSVLLTLTYHISCAPHDDFHSLNKLAHLDAVHLERIFGDLLNKLGEAAFSIPDFRVRRHSSDKNNSQAAGERLCCHFPNLSNKRDVRECHTQFILNSNITLNEPTILQKQLASQCFMECIAAKKGWINADGYAEKTAVNASLQIGAMSPQWRHLQSEAVEKCFIELENEQEMDKLKNVTCKSGSQLLLYCIFEHTFLNCPKDSWNETEKCRAALSLVSAASSTRRQSHTINKNE